MKSKFMKKLFAMALAVTVAVTAVPVSAAPTYSKDQTLYMTSSSAGSTYTSISINNLTKSQTIAKSSVKSSNSKVAKLYYLERSTSDYSYKTDYFENGLKPNAYSSKSYSYRIGLQLKKAGTSKISFAIKGIKGTKTIKVTVKKYANPVSSMKISGISGDLKNKTKSGNSVSNLKLTKTTKNAAVSVKASKGWKIEAVQLYDTANDRTTRMYSYSKPVSSAKLNVGTLTKNKAYRVEVTFVNSSNGSTLYCYYYINQK